MRNTFNSICCLSAAPQVAPQENHFGQVDVNDLLSKLISNGIIKPSQPDAAAQTAATGESTRLLLPTDAACR